MIKQRGTLVGGLALLFGLLVAGMVVPVPVVSISRGPTFDTLGEVEGTEIVSIDSLPTFPTTGRLNMTTVSVTDRLTTVEAIARWASPDFRVVPRSALFPPSESGEQVAERNRQQFYESEASAEAAALAYLGLPVDVTIQRLTDQSPAAGVLLPGDRLVEVAGQSVLGHGVRGLNEAMAATRAGQQVKVRFQRGDDPPRDAVVTLGSSPDGQRGMLGIVAVAQPPVDDDIVISLGDIGGPSAGLMFALAIVDKLTPGELTGGRFIAGTGTIRFDGAVGDIAGIPFKMLSAREAGATVFLVPAANCEEAAATAPDGLTLVKVDDLAGAVAGLDALRSGGIPAGC